MIEQLKLAFIPQHSDSRLYESLVEIKPKFWVGSGYYGVKELVFYSTANDSEHVKDNEVGRIVFENFKTAYEFILNNKIKNFNIECGSYEKEIKQYKKERSKK